MDQPQLTLNSARRDEDIALDLFKFIASTTGAGRPGVPSAGFTAAAGSKPDDQFNHLLELYTRCLKTISRDGK